MVRASFSLLGFGSRRLVLASIRVVLPDYLGSEISLQLADKENYVGDQIELLPVTWLVPNVVLHIGVRSQAAIRQKRERLYCVTDCRWLPDRFSFGIAGLVRLHEHLVFSKGLQILDAFLQ